MNKKNTKKQNKRIKNNTEIIRYIQMYNLNVYFSSFSEYVIEALNAIERFWYDVRQSFKLTKL